MSAGHGRIEIRIEEGDGARHAVALFFFGAAPSEVPGTAGYHRGETQMGFDQLPEFTQGGAARAEMGAMGIPLESLQAPPDQPSAPAAPHTQPGEDVIGREVDALTGIKPMPPVQPAAPGYPDTQPQAAYAPGQVPDPPRVPLSPGRSIEERISAVHNKYAGDFRKLAEAHIHSEAARTRAQQDRSTGIDALRRDVEDKFSRLENLIVNGRPASTAPTRPANGQGYGVVPASPGNGAPAIDPALFQNDPATAVAMVVGPIVEETIGRYSRAQIDALAQRDLRVQQAQWQAQQAEKLRVLGPLMDQIYSEKPHLYEHLHPQHRQELLLEAAQDRAEALRARAYHAEISEVLGVGGTPGASPAPPQTGALPGSAGAGARRPGPAPTGDWGNTPAMNRLWRSNTDVAEMRATTDVLKERGFGERIPFE